MLHAFLQKLSRTAFVQSAVAERADLSAFRERPTPRIVLGLTIIGFSYLIGWPAISALGVLSIYWDNPLIIAVGGPLVYGLSHLVFIVGMYFAGARHTRILMKWAARTVMEKLMGDTLVILPQHSAEKKMAKRSVDDDRNPPES